MPHARARATGRVAWAHAGAASAVAVHLPHRNSLVAGTGGSFRGVSGNFGAGGGTLRARSVARDACWLERSGHSSPVGLGCAMVAREKLSVSSLRELAAGF